MPTEKRQIWQSGYKNGSGDAPAFQMKQEVEKGHSDRIFKVIFRVGQVTETKHFYEIRLKGKKSKKIIVF